jgi:hypothetical protein
MVFDAYPPIAQHSGIRQAGWLAPTSDPGVVRTFCLLSGLDG